MNATLFAAARIYWWKTQAGIYHTIFRLARTKNMFVHAAASIGDDISGDVPHQLYHNHMLPLLVPRIGRRVFLQDRASSWYLEQST